MIDLTDKKIAGGYRKVKGGKTVIIAVLENAFTESMEGAYCSFRCQGEYSQMTGFLLGTFRERFDAAKPGEEFRWSNARYTRLHEGEVQEIVGASPYKEAWF